METIISVLISFIVGYICRCILDRRAAGRDGATSSGSRPGDSTTSGRLETAQRATERCEQSVTGAIETTTRVAEGNARAGDTIQKMQNLLKSVRRNNSDVSSPDIPRDKE